MSLGADTTFVELTTPELVVRIDPARGGVISSVLARRAGVELLFQAPWPAGRLELAGRDEEAWTTAWQGGWSLLFPNAGAACEVDGRRHPFHGAASFTPWAILDQRDASVRLRWASADGFTVQREISAVAGTVHVENVVTNGGPRPAPYILVEHLILGGELLGPSTHVQIEAATVIALANEGHRLSAHDDSWPRVLRDGVTEDWSMRPPDGTARFGALYDFAVREVRVDVPDRGLRLRLSWSEGFPSLWFWEERAWEAAPPWNRQAICLGLEPSNSPTGEGLAAALERADAPVLEPGAEEHTAFEFEVTT